MQPADKGVEGIDRPRTQFINGLPARLNQIANDSRLSEAGACDCALYARLQRVFDLARLLGFSQINLHESALHHALEAYRQKTDTRPAHDLLAVLLQSGTVAEPIRELSWSSIPLVSNRQVPGQYNIHLAVPCKADDYLVKHFTLKNHKVSLHNNPQEILPEFVAPGKHIIVLDESICEQNKLNIFDFVTRHKADNRKFIVLTRALDFHNRLLAARNDTMLVFRAGNDAGELTRSIEKCIALDKHAPGKAMLVSNDDVLADCLRIILYRVGIALDIVSEPSDALLKRLSHNDHDVLLIDYFLDGIYGHELSKIIRQDDILAQLPIIYLCSKTGIECDEHSDLVRADCRVLDNYDPKIIAQTVIDTLAQSSSNRRIGRFMAEAMHENENYRRTIDAHCIISVADITGRILDVNQKFCDVSGYTQDELIGRNHNIVKSGIHPREFFADMWRTIASGKIWHGEICNRKKNGEFYWVASTIVPFLDDRGKPYQYVSARTEITHIKKIENNLRINENRLTRSQSFANIGTWDWNIQNGSLYWSSNIPPLFGYPKGEMETTYENFLDTVHPDDRQFVADSVNACIYQGKDYEIEHRCVWPDGSIKWMLERGDVVRDTNGKPLHMLGVVMDITGRKLAEEQNIRQKHLLEMLRIGLSRYLEEQDINDIANFMLESLLILTDSKFGLIGGVHYDENSHPHLKYHAVSDIASDKKTQGIHAGNYRNSLELHDFDNLLGEAIKAGGPVIGNSSGQETIQGVLPPGHPPLESYLCVPVFHGMKLLAIYCLINKRYGYNEDIIEFLKPFNVAYSAIIQAENMIKTQDETLDELQESRKEAIDANLAKSQFLSSMSHELRTPLNAILGFGQLLEMNIENNLSGSQRDNIHEILKAGHHLLELINQVLDLAKIESGKMDLFIEPVSVIPSLLDCTEIISPLAEKRKIRIHWCLNGNEASTDYLGNRQYAVSADRLRLKQILINFLSNAIKYNNDNGSITIDISDFDPQMTRISIRDTGKGISQDKQARLFHAFDRLGEEGTETEGTGIGLVITKNIAELMQGKIGFSSAEGIGSEFWIDLPAVNHVLTDATISSESSNVSNIEVNDRNHQGLRRIVYIEDNPANMRLIQNILKTLNGFDLVTAQESYLGYELVKLYMPDMVLLDINMPGMNGYEVLDKIKNNPAISKIPVVAISANAMPADIERGMNAGFSAYITKPIIVSELLNTINRLAFNGKNHEIT